MEEEIKDFDRNIEKAMNEYSATPPFGMWNRISAELDVLAPVAATATAAGGTGSTLMSKFGFGTLILAAALESAFLVNYVMSRNERAQDNETALANTAVEQAPANTAVAKLETITIAEKNEPVVKTATKVAPAKKELSAVLAKNENKAAEVSTAPVNTEIANNEVAKQPMPTTIMSNAIIQPADMYFFPPVDINTPEEKDEAKIDNTSTTTNAAPVTTKAIAEKKTKVSSSSNERKWRFHPTKRPKWHYGKLNSRK